MHYTTALAGLGLMASAATAAPFNIPARQSNGQNVIYWGQSTSSAPENPDLAHYCTDEAGVDIVVLSFIYKYGNGKLIPSGEIGSCAISDDGSGQNCEDLASAIETCQSNGKKVILSLGGASGSYGLASQEEAETIGQNLWDAYGGGEGSIPRPFGDAQVDGFDMDIESDNGNENYQYLIAKLRENFPSGSGTYYITGAPQCPVPEPNMNVIIDNAEFDYLFVQFYNNPGCSTDGQINFADWKDNVAGGPSSGAEIFIGVPASPLGATGTESGAKYYLEPSALASLVGEHSSDEVFGGIMAWAAGFSDSNVENGCTYAQQAKSILQTGSAC